MFFEEIALEIFKEEKENKIQLVNEGILNLDPFTAFLTLKDKIQNFEKVATGKASNIRARALIFKERIAASRGATSGGDENATVYKLTPEQKEVMTSIFNKYGKELQDEINDFRVDVLAPYQLIKRIVNDSKIVSSKDIAGMTKEQYNKNYKSGKKKIENRGKKYFDSREDKINLASKHREKIENYEEEIRVLEAGHFKGVDSKTLVKLYKELKVSSKDFPTNYSLERTRELNRKIINLEKKLERELKSNKEDENKISEIRYSLSLAKKGEIIDSDGRRVRTDPRVFSKALNMFKYRLEVKEDIKNNKSSIHKNSYLKILIKSLEKEVSFLKSTRANFDKKEKRIEFNELESKIWKVGIGGSKFSGDIKDYYLNISKDEFLDKPIRIKKSDKLVKAQQTIENEIRSFERKIEKIISPEDYKLLKKYRVINRLISVKDLKNPSALFKSSTEIKKELKNNKED